MFTDRLAYPLSNSLGGVSICVIQERNKLTTAIPKQHIGYPEMGSCVLNDVAKNFVGYRPSRLEIELF